MRTHVHIQRLRKAALRRIHCRFVAVRKRLFELFVHIDAEKRTAPVLDTPVDRGIGFERKPRFRFPADLFGKVPVVIAPDVTGQQGVVFGDKPFVCQR